MDYRTDLTDFALDQLDFIEAKLKEACSDATGWKASLIEAGGAIPQLKERLREEDPDRWASLMLFPDIFNNDWWDRLAKMERGPFLDEVVGMLEPGTGIVAQVKRIVERPLPGEGC